MFTLLFLICYNSPNNFTLCDKCSVFFYKITSFVSLFQDTFQAFFCPLFVLLCHCCAGLVCTLYTGGLCAFPCLSPCSHSNLLPDSLPAPLLCLARCCHATTSHCNRMKLDGHRDKSLQAAGRLFMCWLLQGNAFHTQGNDY